MSLTFKSSSVARPDRPAGANIRLCRRCHGMISNDASYSLCIPHADQT